MTQKILMRTCTNRRNLRGKDGLLPGMPNKTGSQMRILKLREVMDQTGVKSRNTLRRYCNIGLLTKPVRVGLQSGGWPDHEIEAILRARVAGSDDGQVQALVKQLHAQRTQPVAA